MSDAKLKLTYLNLRGRAEVIRLLLTAAGKEFEDERIAWEDLAALKPSLPLGQVPVMDIDGDVFPQSVAIANYFAREFGFYGKTNWDQLRIDVIVQLAQDFNGQWGKGYYHPNEDFRREQLERVKYKLCPVFLGYIEATLKETGTGWVVGDSLTMADIVVYDIMTGALRSMVEHVDLNDYPLLRDNMKRFENIDKIKEYLATRPDTPF